MLLGFSRKVLRDPTAISLLFSNLITIVLAVVFSWSLIELLWVYLAQSVIIGFFNFLKMIKVSISHESNPTIGGMGIFMSIFFFLYYGGFHLVYFLFLFMFSLFAGFGGAGAGFISFLPFLLLTSVIFFINHFYSFWYFSKKSSSVEGPTKMILLGKLMFRPYVRIVPMHLTIIFGGIFIFTGIFNVFVLLLFLILKTWADLTMHFKEHEL